MEEDVLRKEVGVNGDIRGFKEVIRVKFFRVMLGL